jgi:glycosyltransferase involved in cell wall biosynthesis
MRIVAVPITESELRATPSGRALWDRDLLYTSLIRWGQGRVLPAEGRAHFDRAWREPIRALAKAGGRNRRWQAGDLSRRFRDVAQVQRIAVDARVDVLYGHITFPVSRPTRPTVWSTQGVLDARPGSWHPDTSARTHERLIKRAGAAHCWSITGLRGLLDRFPALSTMIDVVPPLVYVDLPEPMVRSDGDVVAIFIGAFGGLKGIDVVIDAARRAGPGLRVEIVTNDPRPPDVPAAVDWLGPRAREEVLSRLASADIHIFPSTTESFGGVVAEALAAGVPQIVDQASVTAEIMGDGGLAVPGRDPTAVADALEELAGDGALRRRLGEQGRARYQRVYAPEVVGPQLEALFERATAT